MRNEQLEPRTQNAQCHVAIESLGPCLCDIDAVQYDSVHSTPQRTQTVERCAELGSQLDLCQKPILACISWSAGVLLAQAHAIEILREADALADQSPG